MSRKIDRWTTALMALAVIVTLLACKKRTSPTPPAAETAAALPPSPPVSPPPAPAPTELASAAPAAADASEPKLGEVKRYPDKEKAQTGAVRILADDVKVFNEADDKTADVATLTKNLLVFRIASVPNYELVEFPSGVGKVSPGWVLAKFVDAKADAQADRGAVAAQTAQAAVKTPPKTGTSTTTPPKPADTGTAKVSPEKAAADKAAAEKAAADKAAAEKAAAEKAAADKAAAEKAARRAEALAKRAAERAKKAAAATGGTAAK